jgi:hypothetical protein
MRKARLEGEAGIYTPLARLGVGGFNTDTKGTDMMLRIAERMKGMSDSAAFTFGRELGFDDATIRTLQQGRGEVEKLIGKYKELGVYSQKDFEAARKLKSAMLDLRQSFVYLQTQLMRFVAPALEWIAIKMTAITKWMRDNEQYIRVFFYGLAAAITMIAIPAILRMAAAWITAFAPLIIVAGLIALLIDDFLVWKRDGKAALGPLWERLEDFVETLKTIKKEIDKIWSSIKNNPSPVNIIENFERLINLKNLLKKRPKKPEPKGGGAKGDEPKGNGTGQPVGKDVFFSSSRNGKLEAYTTENGKARILSDKELMELGIERSAGGGFTRAKQNNVDNSSTVTNDNKTVSYNYNFYGVPMEEAGKAISSIALEANT